MLQGAAEKLQTHFRLLTAAKESAGHPTYALEHGLSGDEVDQLRRALADDLKAHQRLRREHWLLWLVIAAEVGYDFDGNEYWISFANRVPSWRHFGDRYQIRRWFRAFEEQFGGYRPEGRWAEHFSIIAWPVAHAILPRDLQVQFARYLYDLRYELAKSAFGPQGDIGRVLQRFAPPGSSRFQNLLQHGELTSRLVLALRDEDVEGKDSTIYRPTLARIVGDLERHRSARTWLRDARHVLRDARFVGCGGLQGSGGPQSPEPSPQQAIGRTTPRLCATRSATGGWTLGVWIPNLRALLARSDVDWRSLDQVRVRFADRPDTWLPARALATLSESQQRIASIAGITGGPLFKFDRHGGTADDLVSSLRVEGTPPWLLRVEGDGVARQVMGNHVRAGETYLLLASTPVAESVASSLSLRPVPCSDGSTSLYELPVAATLSSSFATALQQISLGYSVKASVRPLGLVPRVAGSTDGTIWLASEEPLFELSAEFAVRGFLIQLDGANPLPIEAKDGRAFLSLGPLTIGQHDLGVTAIPEASALTGKGNPDTLQLSLFVRSPVPWSDDIGRRAGFRVSADRPDASLSDFAEGRATISIVGPAEREISVELRGFDVNGHLVGRHELGRLTLPADAKVMLKFIRRVAFDKIPDKMQSCPRVDIAFVAGEFGVASISTFQEVAPLRWTVQKGAHNTTARLIDESGSEVPPKVRSFPLTNPDNEVLLGFDDCVRGVEVTPPGSLLCAHHDGHDYTAVVGVAGQARLTDFSELGLAVALSSRASGSDDLVRLVDLVRLWLQARPYGALAATRRAAAVQELQIGIARIVCGGTWVEQFKQCRGGKRDLLNDLKKEIVGHYTGFSTRMGDEGWILSPDTEFQIAEFTAHSATYNICKNPRLCRLAILLAFYPEQVATTSPETRTLLEQLAVNQRLARGAFFAKLVLDLAQLDLHSAEAAA
ncbi:hypothetical protein [Mesorhizobium sp.]|uniref:hypothetical protein n=1 Tax=Mesorhizobium sp. TaxID=1871066 RepID=UPI000FE5FD56|nr:hypothetical protein [Mesorhizobium sp.]RWI72237.1 MAG: hypothetical protein EOR19_24025 [Mesorhizobium sp.]